MALPSSETQGILEFKKKTPLSKALAIITVRIPAECSEIIGTPPLETKERVTRSESTSKAAKEHEDETIHTTWNFFNNKMPIRPTIIRGDNFIKRGPGNTTSFVVKVGYENMDDAVTTLSYLDNVLKTQYPRIKISSTLGLFII
jgi:hypothetical protein